MMCIKMATIKVIWFRSKNCRAKGLNCKLDHQCTDSNFHSFRSEGHQMNFNLISLTDQRIWFVCSNKHFAIHYKNQKDASIFWETERSNLSKLSRRFLCFCHGCLLIVYDKQFEEFSIWIVRHLQKNCNNSVHHSIRILDECSISVFLDEFCQIQWKSSITIYPAQSYPSSLCLSLCLSLSLSFFLSFFLSQLFFNFSF